MTWNALQSGLQDAAGEPPEYAWVQHTRQTWYWQNKLAIHDCSLLCLPACLVSSHWWGGSCQSDISSAFLLEVTCFITPTHNFWARSVLFFISSCIAGCSSTFTLHYIISFVRQSPAVLVAGSLQATFTCLGILEESSCMHPSVLGLWLHQPLPRTPVLFRHWLGLVDIADKSIEASPPAVRKSFSSAYSMNAAWIQHKSSCANLPDAHQLPQKVAKLCLLGCPQGAHTWRRSVP